MTGKQVRISHMHVIYKLKVRLPFVVLLSRGNPPALHVYTALTTNPTSPLLKCLVHQFLDRSVAESMFPFVRLCHYLSYSCPVVITSHVSLVA